MLRFFRESSWSLEDIRRRWFSAIRQYAPLYKERNFYRHKKQLPNILLKKWGNTVTVVPKNKAIQDASKYHGYFVLVFNKEKNPFECLRKYRKREMIESFLHLDTEVNKGELGSQELKTAKKLRTWVYNLKTV